MSYETFRAYISEIDKALDAIKRAKEIPADRARAQSAVKLEKYYDGYWKPTKEIMASAQSALNRLVEDARRDGEVERDSVIAGEVAKIEAIRDALSGALGAAVIDLGRITREAASA